jgi:hypothetical protein
MISVVNLVQSFRFRAAITIFFGITAIFVPQQKSTDPNGALKTIVGVPEILTEKKGRL